MDAGAIPPLLRTFLMGIPELRAHLEATATEGVKPASGGKTLWFELSIDEGDNVG